MLLDRTERESDQDTIKTGHYSLLLVLSFLIQRRQIWKQRKTSQNSKERNLITYSMEPPLKSGDN